MFRNLKNVGVKTMLAYCLSAAALYCGAAPAKAPAANTAARVKELKEIADANWCSYNCWCNWYDMRYMKGASDEECDRAFVLCTNAVTELELLQEKVGQWPFELGKALLFKGDFRGAVAAFDRALGRLRQGRWEWAEAYYLKASALFGAGDRAAALAALKELDALKLTTSRRGAHNPALSARSAIYYLEGKDMDILDLPVDSGAMPFPEPRKASYGGKFASPKGISVSTSGIAAADVRVKLLEARLSKFGFKVGPGGEYKIGLSVKADAPVDKPEGYLLEIGEKGALVEARDAQGLLWGVVSLLQCVDREKRAIRECRVEDWPETARRGFLASWWVPTLEYALFNKINSVDVQTRHPTYNFHFDPLSLWLEAEQAKRFSSFGLNLYYGISWLTMYPQLPICKERTLEFRVEVCKRYAASGAGVYFPFDDGRFPLNPLDLEKYGAARNCDADHLNAIFRAVRKEYPSFKMIFCPPFYWGPDSQAKYPEEREPYLKSLGDRLDPEIDVYWTGPMVKGFDKTKRQVEWYSNLVGRKPYIFQNGVGAHNLVGYTIDTVPIGRWHYKGFYSDIAGYHHNSHTPVGQSRTATICDCLWNPDAFDERRSIRRGFGQLVGTRAYDMLEPGLSALAYFDKYKYGAPTVDILKEDVADLERKVALARECWRAATNFNPAVAWYGEYGRGVGFAEKALAAAKNPPDLMKKYQPDMRRTAELAAEEAGFDAAKGDMLFTAADMFGTAQIFNYAADRFTAGEEKRFVRCMRGSGTGIDKMSFSFVCDPFPPPGDYSLSLCCLKDEGEKKADIAVILNGQTVFRGEPALTSGRYSVFKVKLPFEHLKRGNSLSIVSMTEGSNPQGTPWFMVNYAVVHK